MQSILRVLLVVGVFVSIGRAAFAQAMPTAMGPGSYASVGGGVSAFQADYGQRWLGGGFVFVDVHPHWRYGLEGEVRRLNLHTDEQVKQTTYLGGLHVYLRPQKFRPYVKFLAGVAHMDFPFGYATGNYLALAPGAGIDYQVNDWLSVRAVDLEYQDWPKFTFGNLHPYGVSTGISVRLNPIRRYPRHRYSRSY